MVAASQLRSPGQENRHFVRTAWRPNDLFWPNRPYCLLLSSTIVRQKKVDSVSQVLHCHVRGEQRVLSNAFASHSHDIAGPAEPHLALRSRHNALVLLRSVNGESIAEDNVDTAAEIF